MLRAQQVLPVVKAPQVAKALNRTKQVLRVPQVAQVLQVLAAPPVFKVQWELEQAPQVALARRALRVQQVSKALQVPQVARVLQVGPVL